jgi:ribosomal protein S27E
VGVRDSGQFNYHLDRLVGTFVDRDEDGYGITTAGAQLVGAVLAGQYTKNVESDPVDVGTACPDCGTPLRGVFDGGYGQVRCEHCDRCIISLPVPPGAFEDYLREEWPFVAERWATRQFEMAAAGFCPVCHGPMTSRLEPDFERIEEFDIPDAFAAVELSECERCGETMYSNAEASVVTHPAVVAFHHDHGVDVAATPIRELDWAVEPRSEVVGDEPLRVESRIELGDERLAVVLDESGDVVETCRSTSGDAADPATDA